MKSEKEIISEAAALLGRKGGSAKSEKKTKSCRENGKKGGWPKGRPRKKVDNI
ncbi:MAG: hypothetical protein M0P71_17415 [Melioribacteraceae bacterium]|nr:hypothetical protein [Melioribacteraceae bacterium]